MKSLKAIQILAKIARVLCKIVFILCIVGFCLSVAGIVSLALGFESFKIGGVTVKSIVENKAGLDLPTLYAALASGIVLFVAEAVLSKFAEIYFENELADGTPFTRRGAKELMRLGILSIALPLAAWIFISIGAAAASRAYPEIDRFLSGGPSLGLGIMMIIGSLFCRYGAELRGERPDDTAPTEESAEK